MPMVVLTADAPYPAVQIPGVPADMNLITRNAQDTSQREVARLVPAATHVTETDSGHDIMLENPVLVSDSILEVLTAVREGRSGMELDAASRALLDQALDDGFAQSGAAGATVALWIPGRGEWVATRGVAHPEGDVRFGRGPPATLVDAACGVVVALPPDGLWHDDPHRLPGVQRCVPAAAATGDVHPTSRDEAA